MNNDITRTWRGDTAPPERTENDTGTAFREGKHRTGDPQHVGERIQGPEMGHADDGDRGVGVRSESGEESRMKLLKNGWLIEATPEEAFELMQMYEPKQELKKPAPKTKKIGPKKKDLGKVKALREAGWPVTKIADEFGMAEQTVRNWMKEAEA